jgi:hypothetical protein
MTIWYQMVTVLRPPCIKVLASGHRRRISRLPIWHGASMPWWSSCCHSNLASGQRRRRRRSRLLLRRAPLPDMSSGSNYRDSSALATHRGGSTAANVTSAPTEPRRTGASHTPPSISSTTLNRGTIDSPTTAACPHGSNLCYIVAP